MKALRVQATVGRGLVVSRQVSALQPDLTLLVRVDNPLPSSVVQLDKGFIVGLAKGPIEKYLNFYTFSLYSKLKKNAILFFKQVLRDRYGDAQLRTLNPIFLENIEKKLDKINPGFRIRIFFC